MLSTVKCCYTYWTKYNLLNIYTYQFSVLKTSCIYLNINEYYKDENVCFICARLHSVHGTCRLTAVTTVIISPSTGETSVLHFFTEQPPILPLLISDVKKKKNQAVQIVWINYIYIKKKKTQSECGSLSVSLDHTSVFSYMLISLLSDGCVNYFRLEQTVRCATICETTHNNIRQRKRKKRKRKERSRKKKEHKLTFVFVDCLSSPAAPLWAVTGRDKTGKWEEKATSSQSISTALSTAVLSGDTVGVEMSSSVLGASLIITLTSRVTGLIASFLRIKHENEQWSLHRPGQWRLIITQGKKKKKVVGQD